MKKSLLIIPLLALALNTSAAVHLPAYFSDNMIVQQKSVLKVKGQTDKPGSVITVTPSWGKSTTVTSSADGKFMVEIPTPKAGTSYTLTIDDGDASVKFSNVASGEVWMCSGQSNMEMPVEGWGNVLDHEQEVAAAANYPQIRIIQSKHVVAHQPQEDVQLNTNGWEVCSPENIGNFSSVAYFFGRQLAETLGVPVGLIDSSWGGTPAEAWTSLSTLENVIGFEELVPDVIATNGDINQLLKIQERENDKWQRAMKDVDAGYNCGIPVWVNSEQTDAEWRTINLPGLVENNGMPDFNGTIWFQRVVEIPEEWAGKSATLRLAKIDDSDVTYFNGEVVGSGSGYDRDRVYKIDGSLIKPGTNILTVHVNDTGGEGGIWGDAADMSLRCGNDIMLLSGPWRYHIGALMSDMPREPKPIDHPNYVSNLYHAMLYPYRDLDIKGVIWYQGEENASRHEQYTPLFQAMIQDWRSLWNKNLPFYFVQLAGWQTPYIVQPASDWAHLREAQANALKLENTGMAVAVDIGEPYDIHPKNKQEVARRLSKAALAHTYGKGKYEVPAMTDYKVEGDRMIVSFNQPLSVASNALTQDAEPVGFVICGPDYNFYPAKAIIQGNKVTLSSDNVAKPIAVRYGWADCPICNVVGNEKLPLAPFRTDNYR